jgi:2-amino-1-hydroxyethylphosphonate dioxygenase (glycine-forming)
MKGESPAEVLKQLYIKHGCSNYIGEPISQIEHSLQAAERAEEDGAPISCIVAALLHDVGHMIGLERSLSSQKGNCGIESHEDVGAKYLHNLGFDDMVCSLVQNHVRTKRYLASLEPSYVDTLSQGSRLSLIEQGGKMSDEERSEFEKDPYFDWHMSLRKWDDLAKRTNYECTKMDAYFNLITQLFP